MFRITLLSLLISTSMLSQDYRWPIRASQSLSATFCEYRAGHLHAGIDIKTWGEMEVPCLSIADGYIERIIVSYNGYGRGVFIRLTDGNIAVYGHLELFTPELEQLVQEMQQENQKYPLRLKFEEDQYPVQAGQLIGYSGTSGTEHPHLHFEIRDSLNHALNPQLFYPKIKDTQAPILDEILLIPATANSRISGSNFPVIVTPSQSNDGPIPISGPFKIAINAHDRANGTYNKYNIYNIESYVNDSLSFRREFNQISMRHSGHIDLIYPGVRGKRGWRFMSMYSDEEDTLNLFAPKTLSGIIHPQATSVLRVKLRDINKNTKTGKIVFQQRALANWTVLETGNGYSITRSYANNAYERYQFFSADDQFLPVSETLYRLHSTTWLVQPKSSEDGIRGLGSLEGEIKWIIPPKKQVTPDISHAWKAKGDGFILCINSQTPYIFPINYKLEVNGNIYEGELTQTSATTAETDNLELVQRAKSQTLHMSSMTYELDPWATLSPQDSLSFESTDIGYLLQANNTGTSNLYLKIDTLTSIFNQDSVVGMSISILGGEKGDFTGRLTVPYSDGSRYSFFSPGKKNTWRLEKGSDSSAYPSLTLNRGGTFFLLKDDTAPTVKALKTYRRVKQGSRMVFKINDNSGRIPRPYQTIDVRLDGHLIFPDYNPLRKEVSLHAPLKVHSKMHTLEITVSDESGNMTNFEHRFSVTQ